MLYNVKDVSVIVSSDVVINDGSNNKPTYTGGGGSGTGSGGVGGPVPPTAPTLPTPGNGDVTNSTTEVSGLITYGVVVAAVKQVNGVKKPIIIDEAFEKNEVVIDNNIVTTVGNNYVILKTESTDATKQYMQFHTGGSDFSSYLGHRVEMKYRYNPDGGVGGRYEIESVKSNDTEVVTIDGKNIKRDKTAMKNENASSLVICYTDGERDYELPLSTADVNTIKVIYNNKLVDSAETLLTLDDLMPQTGSITVVDEGSAGGIDLIWVEAYETYVVGDRSFNATPKSITDKFRTDENGQALKLILDETDHGVNIRQNNEEIEITDIVNNMILKVAQSKCGTVTDITAERSGAVSVVLSSVKTVGGVKKAFVAKSGATYNLSDYYLDYVDSELEYETGDSLTIYVNSMNEVVWMLVAEPTYSVGYLVSAAYNESTEALTLRILSSGGTITAYTMADRGTRYITKAYECLSDVTPDNVSNPNGYLYKNLNKRLIRDSLQENAAKINEGKGSSITSDAATAQPIRYALSTGTEISTLLTLEPDETNAFRGESLMYEKDANTGRLTFRNSDNTKSFSAATSATVIFVPNTRDNAANYYKIGTMSSLSAKFVEYMNYNIEPYYVTSNDGKQERTVFVVYNQNIDAQPTYRSDNVIVERIEETNPSGTLYYIIHGYTAKTGSTNKYTCYSLSALENAYVLDENFERTGERRAVEAGDVIRFGTSPIGAVATIELIFDASEEYKDEAAKTIAVSNESAILQTPSKNYVYYYARLGEIVGFDQSNTPEFCTISLGDAGTSMVSLGTSYATKKILLFDYTATNLPNTDKDDRFKEVTMGDLWGGEMLFVWQGQNLLYKQIYAVRYPAKQTPSTPDGSDTPEAGGETTDGPENTPETDDETEGGGNADGQNDGPEEGDAPAEA